jgi:hypothetical protein
MPYATMGLYPGTNDHASNHVNRTLTLYSLNRSVPHSPKKPQRYILVVFFSDQWFQFLSPQEAKNTNKKYDSDDYTSLFKSE